MFGLLEGCLHQLFFPGQVLLREKGLTIIILCIEQYHAGNALNVISSLG